MNSIRTKLFLNISFLVIFFVFISWMLSTLVLKEFYMWNKKHSIIESAEKIDTIYNSNSQDISLELERIASSLGAGIDISDREGYVKYSSFDRFIQQNNLHHSHPHNPPPFHDVPGSPPPPFLLKTGEEAIDGKSVIETEWDQALNIEFIVLTHQLNNNDVLNIKLPLAAVAESASYASNFTALTGILSILIGCCWAFVFSKKFTVPLLELSQVAQSISQLDFSQKCTIENNDEIGRLGHSINHLSYQLDKSITELHQKNQQLAADVEKERRLDKLRKNFISSVSHELKTPISLILGYAEGLKENINRDEENKNYYCSVIIDEAEKMAKLVKDLLNLSQIESGFFHLEKADFNLSALLDDILLKYQSVLGEKNIHLSVEKAPVVMANGDMLRIEQVVINLLNNAIDHVEGTQVIRINVTQDRGKIRMNIYNTGKHIPENSLTSIWLSFYKVDPARTRSLGGYGLGLSIVRAIQELHGNAYGVDNVEDGVLFWFHLDPAV